LTDAHETLRRHEILLIGANGFLGKVVLGLLLDRFPEFKHLYILVRPRQNTPAFERFQKDVVGSPALAAIVQKVGPQLLEEKITILPGDIAQPGCGIEPGRLERLVGRVGLVINCAGLVEFFPPVDDSFQSNVDGVEHVVAITKQLGAKLLHVSTCFVCGEADGLIEESEPILGYYPRRKGPHDMGFRFRHEIRYMRERVRQVYEEAGVNGREHRSKDLAQRLADLGWQRAAQWGWVNTYTYAKSLGEQLIAAEEGLEYTIVRPAIVEAALHFPFPGWVEGGRTAAPLVMMAMGGLRHWTIREDLPLEVVPVDMVAASILIAGVLLLNGETKRVYQIATADVNPFFLGPLVRLLHKESCRRRRSSGLRWPRLPTRVRVITPARARARRIWLQRRLGRFQHIVVALRKVVKRAGLPGRRPLSALAVALRALSLQALVREQALELYRPFIFDNRFIFEAENIRLARAMLAEKDRQLLPWAPERIDWEDYWINHEIRGVEKWVQKNAAKEWTFKV
jgi:long-chain acyl-CoA synthetase